MVMYLPYNMNYLESRNYTSWSTLGLLQYLTEKRKLQVFLISSVIIWKENQSTKIFLNMQEVKIEVGT